MLGLAAVVGACGGATAPTLAPSEPAQTAPAVDPSASLEAGPRFSFDPSVVVAPELIGMSSLYINPGALIDHENVLHMFPNLFSRWPGHVDVPHLTSDDGIAWTLDPGSAELTSDDFPLADPGIDVSTGFVTDDGTWVLVYETVSTSKPWVIGRATAPGPNGPWTIDPEPIVTPGASGSWDAGGVQWPSVVRAADGWWMYFTGLAAPQEGPGSIGLATSTDGVTWTKRQQPVLEASERWEGRSLDRPRVVSTPGGLVMVYSGKDLTDRGIATSTDGVSWTRVPGPAIEQSDFPVPGRSWDAALLYRGEELVYYLEIGGETTKVYRASLDWP